MDLSAFKVSLVYRARIAEVNEKNSVSKNKKKKEKKQTKQKATEVGDRHRSLDSQVHSAQEVSPGLGTETWARVCMCHVG